MLGCMHCDVGEEGGGVWGRRVVVCGGEEGGGVGGGGKNGIVQYGVGSHGCVLSFMLV